MRRSFAPIVLLALTAAVPAGAEQRVGVSSAVNPAASGTPPGGQTKRLVIGEDVVFNEHIATGADGQTQILFVDESAISVGANSDMTIDEFVYDPKTGTGTEALSATRGVFRYVGGKLSKQTAPVTIKTPSATIGIRGGVFLLDIDVDGKLDVVFLYGKGLTVTGLGGQTQTIYRPGYSVSVSGRGAAPSSPGPADGSELGKFLAQLDGRGGAHGGAPTVPTDSSVSSSGISQTISGNIDNNIQTAQQSVNTAPPQSTVTQPTINLNLNTATVNQGAGQNQNQNQGPNPPASTGISGGFNSIGGADPSFGFANQITGYQNARIENGVLVATIGGSPTQIPLKSTITAGDTTQSPVGPVTGTAAITPDNTFFYATLNPLNAPGQPAFIYGGTPASPGAYAATGSPQFLAFAIQPDPALNSPIPFLRSGTGGATPNAVVSPLFIAVSPTTPFTADGSIAGQQALAKALQASLAVNGTGTGQSSAIVVAVGNAFNTTGLGSANQATAQPVLNGIAEGSFRPNGNTPSTLVNTAFLTAIDPTGNSFYGGNQISGFVLTPNNCCQLDGSQNPSTATETNTLTGAQTVYGFNLPAVATAVPGIANNPQTAQTLVGFFGGTMQPITNNVAGTPYSVGGITAIVTDPTTLQIQALLVGTDTLTSDSSGVNSLVLSYGSLTPAGTNARQGYINDKLFGVLESPGGSGSSLNDTTGTALLYLVTASAVPGATDSLLPPGVSFCSCQYLQWGYWGGALATSPDSGNRVDVAHINTWLAGSLTPSSDITNLIGISATGNYSGAALGSVVNSGASYLAGGQFTLPYSFATQSGILTINFDGRTFGGTVTGGGPVFTGPLAGSGLNGNTVGAFFGPNAAEAGGNFNVQGANYLASGIYAGQKH